MAFAAIPPAQGLYDPRHEHDACGVGFVADLQGRKSHELIRQALTVLANLAHRGAVGSEANTGDGAGIMLQIPHDFFREEMADLDVVLPPAGAYGVGMFYLPPGRRERDRCERLCEEIVGQQGLRFLGWRTVPTSNAQLGEGAKATEPYIRQLFVGRGREHDDPLAFERALYLCRRRLDNRVRAMGAAMESFFYPCSFSSRTIVYKGMLTPSQLAEYFLDLRNPLIESALALVHSRYATNTFPNWVRAHPYRFLAHNGEINTLRGNVNWMAARQALLASHTLGQEWAKVLPVIDESGSDSGMLDNCLEYLVLSGRSLPHAVMMLVPEPWSRHAEMDAAKKAFYAYHACLMEPWDGPAAIAFCDGVRIGAVLDRNGLRPGRYYLTDDGLAVVASEVGVLELPVEKVVHKGRLRPGEMFLVDTGEGRIVPDAEIKAAIVAAHPYREWLERHQVDLAALPAPSVRPAAATATLQQRQEACGYSFEELRKSLLPLAATGVEGLGSMGNHTPLAVLSPKPQLLSNYFKQLFAQVTNPPIDSIREELITSSETTLGAELNLLQPQAESCRQLRLSTPILTDTQLAQLRELDRPGLKVAPLSLLFSARSGAAGMDEACQRLCREADAAIAGGATLLLLSDRGVSAAQAALPALLAVAGLHHHLIRRGTRTQVGLVLEAAEPRDVHQVALLLGYGAGAINPYLAFESVAALVADGLLTGVSVEQAQQNVVKGLTKGVVKTMAKMGISTIQSYRGAQIFEAVGLGPKLIERFFTRTPSRIGGIELDGVAAETLARHRHAFAARRDPDEGLAPGGKHQWRSDGEFQQLGPLVVHKLQAAVRSGDYDQFKEFSTLADDQSRQSGNLRGLLQLQFPAVPLPLDEVEPESEIVRRFKTGAMSYGSISKEAHEALAIAMNRLGGKSNTGEGGEDPARYHLEENGDSRSSAIKQVASGRFGVTSQYLVNARELQIKMAQGAKPGEGGQLPGPKVFPPIARVRHSTPGVGLISPPPHHDIYSIEDLAQLIFDLKNANDRARISVKLVAEVGVGTIAAGVAKAKADVVLISGHDGGTGASPLSSIHHSGVPWELGLAETHQTLVLNGLRDRIAVETDGQLRTGRDVVIAALLGADEFGFATVPLVALGCIMMRACHLNTCPVGVATQDPRLRTRFAGSPEHVVNYFTFVAREVRELMARLGFRRFDEMVGQCNRLALHEAPQPLKARALDLRALLHCPPAPEGGGPFCRLPQGHDLHKSLDRQVLLELCAPALEQGEKVRASLPIRNRNRAAGTILGSEITRRFGAAGLPEDTIRLKLLGSAGQSCGAFIPPGLTLVVEGDANDYLGKGLSGGRIVVRPSPGVPFRARDNIIVGNVVGYGATAGELFVGGIAGERFCVRNSGATAVVEGVGDHGCEYMTGGTVVVLGPTGRNFAAGMSGGIAYVYDARGDFARRCNGEMVELQPLDDPAEAATLRTLVERFQSATRSELAAELLADWGQTLGRLVRVMPRDYQRMRAAIRRAEEAGLSGAEAEALAFEENAHALERVGGN